MEGIARDMISPLPLRPSMSRPGKLLPLLLLAACPKKLVDETPTVIMPDLAQAPSTSGWREEELDLNGDGRVEIVKWYDGSTLARQDMDFTNDGRMDVFSYYDAGGVLTREDMDGDYDGVVDWIDHYEGGVLARSEADTDYDGKVNVIFYYQGGVVTRKERFDVANP